MGLFDFFGKKDKVIEELSKEVIELKAITYQNTRYENLLSQLTQNTVSYPDISLQKNVTRFCTNDDVYSIVTMLARTAATIPIYGYKVQDEKSFKQLSRIKQPHLSVSKTKYWETKALIDLENTDRVERLLEDPGIGQSKFEFYLTIYYFMFILGEVFIRKQRPNIGPDRGLTTSLEVLFPQYVNIKVSSTFPRSIVGYSYVVDGHIIYDSLAKEDIIHIKYFNPNMDYMGYELRGLSPLSVAAKRLFRIDANTDTGAALLRNGGVHKFIYDKWQPHTEQAKQVIDARRVAYYDYTSNKNNAGSAYFGSGDMGVIDIGSTVNDLSLVDLQTMDYKKLCNIFGISDRLLNNDATGSEISDNNARESLYNNAVLPNVYMVRDALKMGLLDEFENGRVFTAIDLETGQEETVRIVGDRIKRDLREDLSEITVLQDDMLKMSQWMAISPEITYNERRLMKKYDRLENPLFDQPFLPSGLQTPDDLIIPGTIPDDPNNPNGN